MRALIAAVILLIAALATHNTKHRWLDPISRICAFGCGFAIADMILH